MMMVTESREERRRKAVLNVTMVTYCHNAMMALRMMMTMRYDDKYDHDDDADTVDGNDDLELLEAASKAASLAAKRPGQVNHL